MISVLSGCCRPFCIALIDSPDVLLTIRAVSETSLSISWSVSAFTARPSVTDSCTYSAAEIPARSLACDILDRIGPAESDLSTPFRVRDESIFLMFTVDLLSDASSASYVTTLRPFIAKRRAQLEPMIPVPTQATFFGRRDGWQSTDGLHVA